MAEIKPTDKPVIRFPTLVTMEHLYHLLLNACIDDEVTVALIRHVVPVSRSKFA